MQRSDAGAAEAADAGRTLAALAAATALAVGVSMARRVLVIMSVIMGMIVPVMVVPVMIVRWHRDGQSGRLIGERQQRVALGAGKAAAALFAGKERGEPAGQKQTEEEGDRYDGHAWNACPEYRLISAG